MVVWIRSFRYDLGGEGGKIAASSEPLELTFEELDEETEYEAAKTKVYISLDKEYISLDKEYISPRPLG